MLNGPFAQSSDPQNLTRAIRRLQNGDVLTVSDCDGVLVPVVADALNPERGAGNMRILADYAARHPILTLTGRRNAWEVPQLLAGRAVDRDAPDRAELLAALPPALAAMPNLHNHGNELTLGARTSSVPPPAAEKQRLFDHINAVGALCADLSARIRDEEKADPHLRAIFKGLNIVPQATLLNVNIFNLPAADKAAVGDAAERMLRDANRLDLPPAATVNRFLGRLAETHGVDIAPFKLAEPAGGAAAAASAPPEKVFRDQDGTYIQLGVGRKGRNLLHWIESGAVGLREDQDIVLIADNFQPGGSDRELANDMIAAYGDRVKLWQSLDGKNKTALTPDDPLHRNLQFVLRDSDSVYRLLDQLNRTPAAQLARQIAAGAVDGVRLPQPQAAPAARPVEAARPALS